VLGAKSGPSSPCYLSTPLISTLHALPYRHELQRTRICDQQLFLDNTVSAGKVAQCTREFVRLILTTQQHSPRFQDSRIPGFQSCNAPDKFWQGCSWPIIHHQSSRWTFDLDSCDAHQSSKTSRETGFVRLCNRRISNTITSFLHLAHGTAARPNPFQSVHNVPAGQKGPQRRGEEGSR
jgi:hypothetical protein